MSMHFSVEKFGPFILYSASHLSPQNLSCRPCRVVVVVVVVEEEEERTLRRRRPKMVFCTKSIIKRC